MVKIALLPLSESEFAGLISEQNIIKLRGGSLRDINIFKASRRSLRGEGILSEFIQFWETSATSNEKIYSPSSNKFYKGYGYRYYER